MGELGISLAMTNNQSTLRRNTRLPIVFTLMMEALRSSELSVLVRATGRNVPENGILNCKGTFENIYAPHEKPMKDDTSNANSAWLFLAGLQGENLKKD
jgi:hypothetical protein